MNIIERASKRLGLTPTKSLVEKAAERLAGAPSGAGAFQPEPPVGTTLGEAPLGETKRAETKVVAGAAARVAPRVAPRRETRRQITVDFERLSEKGYALPVDQSTLA